MKTSIFSQPRVIILGIVCGIVMFTGCTVDPDLSNTAIVQERSLVATADELTEDEIASLMYMVEEEKLAMDVYAEMRDLYGLVIFDHINQSELRHVEAVSRLFEKYDGLENPILGNLPGVFVNEEIQQLYTDLIILGSISKQDAIDVGLIIENKDMEDIKAYLAVVVSPDLIQVYSNLLSGSVNHLAAFERELQ